MSSPPTYFSTLSQLKLNLKGRHVVSIEMMEADLLALVNTLTEQGFRDAFIKWQKRWEPCFEGDGGQQAQS
jgi:hypothetical protein